jgi:hypothetical protein
MRRAADRLFRFAVIMGGLWMVLQIAEGLARWRAGMVR